MFGGLLVAIRPGAGVVAGHGVAVAVESLVREAKPNIEEALLTYIKDEPMAAVLPLIW